MLIHTISLIHNSGLNLLNHKAINGFVGDKAYDTNKIRQELDDMDIKAEIPNKRNRKNTFRFDQTIYKLRYRIENLVLQDKRK